MNFLSKVDVLKNTTERFLDFFRSGQKIKTDGTLILAFHGLVENIIDPYIQTNHMTTDNFTSLLKEITRYRDVIPYNQLSECFRKKQKVQDNKVILTFDDGYESNLTLAAPILSKLGIPWSIFVSTKHIDTGERLPTYILRAALLNTKKNNFKHPSIGTLSLLNKKEKLNAMHIVKNKIKESPINQVNSIVLELKNLMNSEEWSEVNNLFESEKLLNWEQLGQLVKDGVHVGSHCHNHMILHDKQSSEDIRHELEKSKFLIEKKLNIDCFDLVYPNGSKKDISNKAIDLVRDTKYRTASTLIPGFCIEGVNPFYLPRYYVSNNNHDNLRRLRRSKVDNKNFYK